MADQWFRTSPCRSCDARLIFARKDGRRNIPVDAEPSPGGSVELFSADGLVHLRVVPAAERAGRTDLRRPHDQTCPDANTRRRDRRR